MRSWVGTTRRWNGQTKPWIATRRREAHQSRGIAHWPTDAAVASVTSGAAAYNFGDATNYLHSLETELEARNPGAGAILAENDVQPTDAAWKLHWTLPSIISVAFNPSAGRRVLNATIADIAESLNTAKPVELQPRDEWQQRESSINV